MPLLRSNVADGETEDVAPVELRVREKHFAAGVHGGENAGVHLIECFFMNAGRRVAEADEREGNRGDDFPLGLIPHPRGELAREDAVAADARREASRAEATNDHP